MNLVHRLTQRRLPSPADARAIRVAAGATQAEVAQEVGVSASAVAAWEAGVAHPRAATAERYRTVLDALAKLAPA